MRYAYGVTTALLLGGAALSLATGLPAGAQVAQNDAQQIQAIAPRFGAPASFAELTQQLAPAVVNISTRQLVQVPVDPLAGTPFAGMFGGIPGGGATQTRPLRALGSGFIISHDGYVVTNNHVVTADNQGVAYSITVTMSDGEEYPAKIVGRDVASDIAVLKIAARKPLPFVKFGESGKARSGDWVIAIGNPFGLGGSVTAGIISAVSRNTGSGAYDHYIQSDASINSGNSGGPMFDMQGNVIGINNWILAASGGNIGIGFAIPSDIAAPIVEKLRRGATVERGYLGVAVQPVSDDIADSLGLAHNRGEFVMAVVPGQGAAAADMQPGDIVIKVDGKDVTPGQSLSTIVANIAPGKRIPIEILREGRARTLMATVSRRPTEEDLAKQSIDPVKPQPGSETPAPIASSGKSLSESALGIAVKPLTPQLAPRLGLPETAMGIFIAGIDPASDAGSKELQGYDIILAVNYERVTTVAEFEAAIRKSLKEKREAVILRVQRPGRAPNFVAVRFRQEP